MPLFDPHFINFSRPLEWRIIVLIFFIFSGEPVRIRKKNQNSVHFWQYTEIHFSVVSSNVLTEHKHFVVLENVEKKWKTRGHRKIFSESC